MEKKFDLIYSPNYTYVVIEILNVIIQYMFGYDYRVYVFVHTPGHQVRTFSPGAKLKGGLHL